MFTFHVLLLVRGWIVVEASLARCSNAKEEKLQSELEPGVWAPHPISKAKFNHSLEETHFGHTLSCKLFQCVLKVIDRGGQQNHIISKKQRCNPESPRADTLLVLAVPPDPVHENQEGDQRQRAALAESNTQREKNPSQLNTEDANTALTTFIQGTNCP